MAECRGALAGLSVAITRPAQQGEALAEQLRSQGAAARCIPLLAIAPLDQPDAQARVTACLDALAQYDVAIFVSRNAADQLIQALALRQQCWPNTIVAIAVGAPTASFLHEHGIAAISPARMDSEGMLALPALQHIQGRRCVIFRGQGGREKTAQTLRGRGASVDYCELYRRVLPDDAAVAWSSWIHDNHAKKLACINSVETLNHLLCIDPDAALRNNLTLIAPGERVTQRAAQAGFLRIHTATNASDDSIFQTIRHEYAP